MHPDVGGQRRFHVSEGRDHEGDRDRGCGRKCRDSRARAPVAATPSHLDVARASRSCRRALRDLTCRDQRLEKAGRRLGRLQCTHQGSYLDEFVARPSPTRVTRARSCELGGVRLIKGAVQPPGESIIVRDVPVLDHATTPRVLSSARRSRRPRWIRV